MSEFSLNFQRCYKTPDIQPLQNFYPYFLYYSILHRHFPLFSSHAHFSPSISIVMQVDCTTDFSIFFSYYSSSILPPGLSFSIRKANKKLLHFFPLLSIQFRLSTFNLRRRYGIRNSQITSRPAEVLHKS